MKELKIIGLEGVELGRFLVNVKGDDLFLTFDVPIYFPIKAITLIEEEKEKPTFREKAEAILNKHS